MELEVAAMAQLNLVISIDNLIVLNTLLDHFVMIFNNKNHSWSIIWPLHAGLLLDQKSLFSQKRFSEL